MTQSIELPVIFDTEISEDTRASYAAGVLAGLRRSGVLPSESGQKYAVGSASAPTRYGMFRVIVVVEERLQVRPGLLLCISDMEERLNLDAQILLESNEYAVHPSHRCVL